LTTQAIIAASFMMSTTSTNVATESATTT
jgi:hypothetical protein